MLRLTPGFLVAGLLAGLWPAAVPKTVEAARAAERSFQPLVMTQAQTTRADSATAQLLPRGPVIPLHLQPQDRPTATSLRRETFGFARAEALSDPSRGWRAWDFNLLSTVAFFDLEVDRDSGTIKHDDAWGIWHSSTGSDLLNAAHAHGTRVVLTVAYQDDGSGMCTALDRASTTVPEIAANLSGADGVNLDYEGLNRSCPGGGDTRSKLAALVRAVRARNLGYLSIDTYASSAEDPGGFFDIPALAPQVDAMFAMEYGLEIPNGPCRTCMGPTSPLTAGPQGFYNWNVTRSANSYQRWAGQVILGFPYYGVKGCTDPSPGANAPVKSTYWADPYQTIATYSHDPMIHNWSGVNRDASGQEPWATYYSGYQSCWREEYWDDATSLGLKYDLVNQRNFRGAGMFTLDYGGPARELWDALHAHFA
jgi:Glycosyl hydrolases family 18